MYFFNHHFKRKINKIQCKFFSYAEDIKEDLLDQIIDKESGSRPYFAMKYDEILDKYLDTTNPQNYSKNCCRFIREIYDLIPVADTI